MTGSTTIAALIDPVARAAAIASAISGREAARALPRTKDRIPANANGQNDRYPASAHDGTGGLLIWLSASSQYTSPAAQHRTPSPISAHPRSSRHPRAISSSPASANVISGQIPENPATWRSEGASVSLSWYTPAQIARRISNPRVAGGIERADLRPVGGPPSVRQRGRTAINLFSDDRYCSFSFSA